jgi:glutathione synthase/RimK-type ligase-like ATP-grasp enzyme
MDSVNCGNGDFGVAGESPAAIVLVTGGWLPKPDLETPMLVHALHRLGVTASVRRWDEPFGWAAAPLVVVRTPWDYFARRAEFLAWAHHVGRLTRLVNPASVLEWNSHKSYLLDLACAGVSTVRTTLVPAGAAAPDQRDVLRRHRGEVVIKPAVSVGALGALRARARSAEAAAHLASSLDAGDVLVQPLERSVLTEGEASLIYFGGRFSHAVRKVPAPGEYRVHDHHGGAVVPHTATAAQARVAAAALAAAPAPTAYARVDLVRLAGRPAVMELELIEPDLFLDHDSGAAARFASHLTATLSATPGATPA